MFSCPERPAHTTLAFLDSPLWHEEQLHLAEWQALQQLEYLFNLTLSVDAKNMALEKLKRYRAPLRQPPRCWAQSPRTR